MNTRPSHTDPGMAAKNHLPFPPGATLAEELASAMERIGACGVAYPEGYYRELLEKYTREGVDYPHILMIIGQPRIGRHFCYPRVLAGTGRLLDYGCGTGDNVRQLLRDRFPRERITAFDISRASMDLGFDLYRDRPAIGDLFCAGETFPFGPSEFGLVYSASVLHVITADAELEAYLKNAYATLRPGGHFFGSTAGKLCEEKAPAARGWGPPRVMLIGELERCLARAGFSGIRIAEKPHVHTHSHADGKNQCILEFCAKKA